MADYTQLLKIISDNIKANGNQEITGPLLGGILQMMVATLGEGYQFMGVATPTTNPGTQDAKVFYLAVEEGQYVNFSGLFVTGEISILQNISTGWQKVTTNIAQADLLAELMSNVYSSGTGTVIPLNLEYAGYFDPKSATKKLVSSTRYASQIVNVAPGEYYRLTIRVGASGMAGVVFFNDDDQNVGTAIPGDSSSHVNQTIRVPYGATQMAVATDKTWASNKIEKVTLDLNARFTEIESTLAEVKSDLNARVEAMETTVEENNEVVTAIADKTSVNVFPGVTVGGYVNSRGNFNSAATEEIYAATDFIPVKPNTYYYISNRNVNGKGGSTSIRCLDENKQNPTKVRIASTGEEYANWYTPNAAGTASTDNGQIKTSPTAAYLQMTLKFNYQGNPDYAKLMLQEVGDTYDPSFVPSPYQPYAEEYKILKKALPDDIGGSSSANHHVVNLRNVPVIMLTGASHGEGYGSVKDKSFVSYLSAMLDWTVENYSLSGSDNIEHFNRIVKGQQISNVHPSNLAGGYSLIILGGNESSYYRNGVDAKYFRDNIIRLCSAIKSYGFEPVLCSYYGDMNRPWSVVVQNVADEYGYMFIDLNANGSRFYSPRYRPWWFNAHYATRTNVIQWFNILKILDNFEKPYSAVKIFRNRNTTPTDINDLLFDNRYEKMKLWRELTLHHIPLKAGYEKYVDRLDLTVYTDTGGGTVSIGATEGVESEYNSFRLGSPITIQDKALIQFTLPSVAPDIENLVLNLDTEDEVDVYVRQYVSPDLEVSLADVGGSFHLTTENPTINIGDVYADSNNADISFTVVDYDASSKSLITVPSGNFTSEGNMTGTLTRTSGTGTQILNYDKLLDVPGESYFEKALSPKGKWVQIQKSGDNYPITGPAVCMDYDRLDFLVKATSGGSFTIKDVSMEFDSTREKNRRRGKDQRCLALTPETGNQLFTKTTFENAVEDWGAPSSATIWNGQVKYMDGNNVQQTGNHIPTYFKTKKNVSKILRLNKGESVHQDVNMIGESYQCHKYKLKIVARYYPEEALDVNSLPADVRTSQTFDFAKIAVSYKFDNGGAPFTKELYVPLNFAELEQDIIFDSPTGLSTNTITITALDDRVELLLCELYS